MSEFDRLEVADGVGPVGLDRPEAPTATLRNSFVAKGPGRASFVGR